LPKDYCERKNIKPGSALRVTEIAGGLYVAPVPEPSEHELEEVVKLAGSLPRQQTVRERRKVEQVIQEYRAEKRRQKA